MRKATFTKIDKLLDLLIDYFTPDKVEDGDEFLYEEAERPSEIIQACANAVGMVDGMDTALMSKADERRVNKIRRRALRLTEEALDAIYETNITENEDNQ